MIVLPDLYLPLDYEVRTVKGPEDEHGSQYAITIAREDADLKIQDGELVGAASRINLLTHDHALTYVAAMSKTCTEAGNIEYWICSACGKYFSDAACTNEITEKDTVVEALGHKIEIQNNREATCTKEGYTGDHVCTVCGEVLQAGIAIPKLDHSFEDGRCTICGLTDSDFKSDAESVSPQTGDSSNSMTWIVLLLTVSGIVFLAALSYRKKDC